VGGTKRKDKVGNTRKRNNEEKMLGEKKRKLILIVAEKSKIITFKK